jgi:hypothetical protein
VRRSRINQTCTVASASASASADFFDEVGFGSGSGGGDGQVGGGGYMSLADLAGSSASIIGTGDALGIGLLDAGVGGSSDDGRYGGRFWSGGASGGSGSGSDAYADDGHASDDTDTNIGDVGDVNGLFSLSDGFGVGGKTNDDGFDDRFVWTDQHAEDFGCMDGTGTYSGVKSNQNAACNRDFDSGDFAAFM